MAPKRSRPASYARQAEMRAALLARRQKAAAVQAQQSAEAERVAAVQQLLADLRAARRDHDRYVASAARALTRRDAAVAGLRAAGYSWADLARLTGTTRQALMKRR